jgi:hypothetical protein
VLANRFRRIAMFARFPRFLPRSDPEGDPAATLLVDESDEPVDLTRACDEFPALADALTELQHVVVPLYRECDAQALLEQNRHRRQQVLLIGGGLLTTTFGLIQAVLIGEVWPGIVVTSFAAATAAVASVGRQSAALDGYLTNRLRAEQLRSAYFLYLSTEADHHPGRHGELREQVTAIRYGDLGTAR